MVDAALPDDPAGHAFGERRHIIPDFLGELSARRRDAHQVVFPDGKDVEMLGAEQPLAGVQDRFEHRRRIGDGSADRAQHVRRGLLPLQRLLSFVEQPRVLDRDCGLISEGLQERLFPVGEWPRRPADHEDGAEAAVLPQHRRIEKRGAAMAVHPVAQSRGQIGKRAKIGDVVGAAFPDDRPVTLSASGVTSRRASSALGPRHAAARTIWSSPIV